MRYNILWIVGLLLLAVGCLDDKNDWDYKDINTVGDSKITEFESYYTCFPNEPLVLAPKVTLSMDSLNPDLSYEWYLDGALQPDKEATYTFVADNIGEYVVIYCAVDNKTGVKFVRSTKITVQSRWMKGWLLLSKGAGGESQLSIVLMNKQLTPIPGGDSKDTLVYVGQDINIIGGLGNGPRKLYENFFVCDYGFAGTVEDEIILLQDNKCVELHGNSLEPVIFTEEEFMSPVPSNLLPVDVAMTTGLKCVINQDGYMYTSKGAVITDYHTGRYPSDPAFAGKKFKNFIPTNRNNADFFLVWDEEDTMHAIIDNASTVASDDPVISMGSKSGALVKITVGSSYDKTLFEKVSYDVVFSSWTDGYYEYPSFVSIMKEKNGSNYFLHTYSLESDTYRDPIVEVVESNDGDHPINSAMMDGFVDAATFCNSKFLIVASGNTLHSCHFGYNTDRGKAFKTFDRNIVSISMKEMGRDDYNPKENFGGGHLGVALDNGEFYIFEVNFDEENEEVVSLRELYHHDGFGNIVDVMYKYGEVRSLSYPYLIY